MNNKYTLLSFFKTLKKKNICCALQRDLRRTKKDISEFVDFIGKNKSLKVTGYACVYLSLGVFPIIAYEAYKKFKGSEGL